MNLIVPGLLPAPAEAEAKPALAADKVLQSLASYDLPAPLQPLPPADPCYTTWFVQGFLDVQGRGQAIDDWPLTTKQGRARAAGRAAARAQLFPGPTKPRKKPGRKPKVRP